MGTCTTHFHAVAGRLRIKVPEIKRAPAKAGDLEVAIKSVPGVRAAIANPSTGSLLVHFDAEVVETSRLIEAVKDFGYLQSRGKEADRAGKNTLVKGVFLSLAEVACQRLFLALIL